MIISFILNLLLNNDPSTLELAVNRIKTEVIESVGDFSIDNIALYHLFSEQDRSTEIGKYLSDEVAIIITDDNSLDYGIVDSDFLDRALKRRGMEKDFIFDSRESFEVCRAVGVDVVIYGFIYEELSELDIRYNVFSKEKQKIVDNFNISIPLNSEIKELVLEAEEEERRRERLKQEELMFLNLSWSEPEIIFRNETVYQKQPTRYMFKIDVDQTYIDLDLNIIGKGFLGYRIKKGGVNIYESFDLFDDGSYEYNGIFDKGIYELYIDYRGNGGPWIVKKDDPERIDFVNYMIRSNIPICREVF